MQYTWGPSRPPGTATPAVGHFPDLMRNRYVLLADLGAIALCILGAFVLRLDWFFTQSPEWTAAFLYAVGMGLAAKPLVFLAFGLYRRYWRYATVADAVVVALAVSAASAVLSLLVAIGVMAGVVPFFPRSIFAIDWLLTLACLIGLRLSLRLVAEGWRPSAGRDAPARRTVLIAGAGDAGALVVREMQKNPQLGMWPAGFLDDHPAKLGKKIYGVPVLARLDGLEDAVARTEAAEVVIAMPTAPGSVVRALLDACGRAGVPARALPGLFELLEGGVSVNRLREVEISDLLRRAPVAPQPDAGLYLQGRVVLVTGAGGSIGSEICRQVAHAHAARVVLVGHGENSIFEIANRLRTTHPHVDTRAVIADIRDPDRLRAVFAAESPSIVFHAAAHKHVPLMEAHAEEAVTNNVLGTRLLVDAAVAAGVERFVLISTDKAVGPTNVMGATKRIAEAIVRRAAHEHGRAFVAVRFGNVLGSRGSVVPYFKQQIEAGGPVTITHPDIKRFFMTIPEAAYLVLKAGGVSRGGELLVLNMGEPVRIVELAHDLIRLSGLSVDEIPVTYTGLRPGEKIEEELWEPGSLVEPAGGPDVFRVREAHQLDGPTLDRAIEEFRQAAARGDVLQIHRILSECIPSFVSSLGVPATEAR
jgi:FlaA1/EpsC-like NDP-sugar epimerase